MKLKFDSTQQFQIDALNSKGLRKLHMPGKESKGAAIFEKVIVRTNFRTNTTELLYFCRNNT